MGCLQFTSGLSIMSTAQTKQKNKEDPRAVKAARLFILMEQHPEDKLSVIDAMKARRYKEDKAMNRVLQMQVHRAIGHLKKEGFGPPTKPSPVVAGPVASAASASAKVVEVLIEPSVLGTVNLEIFLCSVWQR